MNKKLVALGVASAFALPLAAQAQTANVTLYGRLNVDVEWISGNTCAAPLAQGNGGGFVGANPQGPASGNQIISNCPGTSHDTMESNERRRSIAPGGASTPGNPTRSSPVDAIDCTRSAKRINGTSSERTHTSV